MHLSDISIDLSHLAGRPGSRRPGPGEDEPCPAAGAAAAGVRSPSDCVIFVLLPRSDLTSWARRLAKPNTYERRRVIA